MYTNGYLRKRKIYSIVTLEIDNLPYDLLITDKMSYFFFIGHAKNLELQ